MVSADAFRCKQILFHTAGFPPFHLRPSSWDSNFFWAGFYIGILIGWYFPLATFLTCGHKSVHPLPEYKKKKKKM